MAGTRGATCILMCDMSVAGSNAQTLAKELIALRPDVLLANSTPMATAFKQETGKLPILFVSVSDPIGSGFVASIARPQGNMTGLLLYEDGIAGKWLAMLKEVAPALTRAAVIGNPKGTPYDYFLRSISASARMLAIEVVPLRVESVSSMTSTDRTRLSRIWCKASTTMSPERTWIRAPLFWARAFFTVLIDFLSWALSCPALMVRIEG